MTTINTPTGGDDKLKSILEGLSEEKRDDLLEALEGLDDEQIHKLHEMLIKDKKFREHKKLSESWKLIDSESEYFDKITNDIKTMKENVHKINGNRYKLFVSTFEKIWADINERLNDFKSYINECRSDENITYSEIREKIQKILVIGCRYTGWINILMRLLSYSRNSFIKDKMKEHGIDVSLLESICSNVEKMLDEIGIEVSVPTVLVDKFDESLYDFENGDVWIDKFFPILARRDYILKVFDIVRIGIKIKDERGNIIKSEKPKVQF